MQLTMAGTENELLEVLWERHMRLGSELRTFKHRQWLAELPENYVPLLSYSKVKKLYLSQQDKADLDRKVDEITGEILEIAAQIQTIKFGTPDRWLIEMLTKRN